MRNLILEYLQVFHLYRELYRTVIVVVVYVDSLKAEGPDYFVETSKVNNDRLVTT